MSFTEAIRTCFRKYVTIEGRARRSEYWWFLLFTLVCSMVLSAIDTAIFWPETTILAPLFSLAVLLPAICVAIRRLHDRDMSGWWVLLNLIPLIGFLILFVIYALPGTSGPNRFGPDPLADDQRDDGDSYSASSIPRSGRP